MSDIRVKSRWIDRSNSDVVVVTDLLNDLVLFDYCNNESKKSGSRSKSDFIKQFKLLNAAPAPQADMVNHPPHYKDASGIECIEVTKNMQFCGGNCFKYLYRAGQKSDAVEDLRKAKWYAGQAKKDSEKVCWSAIMRIKDVASHRNKNIGAAMDSITREDWQWVIFNINYEIARLESE